MSNSTIEICVVGAGPRGLSVVERLAANERERPSHDSVAIHVVDPSAPGAGKVWRPGQSRHLLMNTVACQITVYTDESCRIDGPIEPGPTLYEWAKSLSVLGQFGGYDDGTLAEAAAMGPDTYPTRAFYGSYLGECFQRVIVGAPKHVTVHVHGSRAVALADTQGIPGGPQGVRLEDGTRLNNLDAIILAQGHVPARLTPREARTASLARIHYLTYLTPGNPADADLAQIKPGQSVLLRGLGLNFFDYMSLFSHGRGGVFVRDENGRLAYQPSGQEPRLYAFSRRGIPYHARGDNEKGAYGRYFPKLLTPDYVQGLRRRAEEGGTVTFNADLWPYISREVESVYYGALLAAAGRPQEREAFVESYLGLEEDEARTGLLAEYGISEDQHWSWEKLSLPYGDTQFADRDAFQKWLVEYLLADVTAARQGNVSGPVKSALDVLRDLRNEVRLAVDHGGLDGDSHRDDLEGWYTPLNGFLSIGPPATRIEEMVALIEAGILTLTGPGTQVRIDTNSQTYLAESSTVPGTTIKAQVLIEARLPEPDLRRTADPLLQHLLDTDQAKPYVITGGQGGYQTGGLAVTERPYRLIDARGTAHPRRFAYGVPTESVHWVTAAGIRPGVDSVTLGDSDAIARAILALPPVAHAPAGIHAVTDDTAEGVLPGVIV
ncbi:FAD/NAD(P)-binding protein [Streptomyces sp. NBC_01351]|uniref:FAD/NAD(P)-binding protein n=1 Tax=Streptomyces sp. NBC_01351 TaxID=2903833 RepID=UPI002E362D73|nr:FAD/NAD(P)-binding protein [Streptomyces sp. NBC_01351]